MSLNILCPWSNHECNIPEQKSCFNLKNLSNVKTIRIGIYAFIHRPPLLFEVCNIYNSNIISKNLALTTCTPDMLSEALTNILIHLIISTTLQVGAIITLFHRFKKTNYLAPEQGSSRGRTQHRQFGSSSPGSKPLKVRSTKISTSSPLFSFLPLLWLHLLSTP